jgi:hypothetical protein
VRVDAQGTQRLQEDYGMMFPSCATTVLTRGNRVLVNGWELRPEGAGLQMVVADANGVMDHTVSYSRPGDEYGLYARSVITAGSDSLAMTGPASGPSTGNRIFVTETDGNLKPLWWKIIGTSGDYVLAGWTTGGQRRQGRRAHRARVWHPGPGNGDTFADLCGAGTGNRSARDAGGAPRVDDICAGRRG